MNAVFKALADPTRRRVLELLRARPMSAGELSAQFPLSKPTMSAHFTVLREANLIDMHKAGKTITYQLNLSVLEDVLLGFAGVFGVGATSAPTSHVRQIEPLPSSVPTTALQRK